MSNGEHELLDLGIPTGVALRDPNAILAEAGERAKALTKMVEETKSFTQIGPSKHLRVEAWITLGQFYGCSAKVLSTEEVSYGGVFGFKARARVTHDATATVLTEAEALCMQDETNWDSKPLHQLFSMAQTRAISKALGLKFRAVVVLGGFAPTPAEEMDGHDKPAAPKLPPAPVLPYGPSKGLKINDPKVPDKDLTGMVKSKQARLEKPDRDPKWDEQDRAMIAACEAELAKRAAALAFPTAQEEVGQTKPSTIGKKPLGDHAWRDLVILWEDSHRNSMEKAKEELGVGDIDALVEKDRWAFYDCVQKYINAAKPS